MDFLKFIETNFLLVEEIKNEENKSCWGPIFIHDVLNLDEADCDAEVGRYTLTKVLLLD